MSALSGVGTSLFEISVQPGSGLIYVPNTDARNFVRFEHELGLQGHLVDNHLSVIDPGTGFSVTAVDLNTHIDRLSNPATNLAERRASISQPGMMVWRSDGTKAYLTAIGSRKLFEVDGTCLGGGCIFGPDRSMPRAVEVGEGPSGVALGILFPPNPHRNVDDTLPDAQVPIPETAHTGNPLNGDADQSPHSDLKVAHLCNLYTKVGMRFGPDSLKPPNAKSGFGFSHDGSVPSLLEFLSINVFTLDADQVRDIASFSLHFPSGTKPCVGQNLTLPGGTAPTGSAENEALLQTLLGISDLANSDRHGELVATARFAGPVRGFHLDGGQWVTDVGGGRWR